MIHKHEKLQLLEQIKELVETSLQMILSTKEAGGNPKNIQWHKIIDTNSDALVKLIRKLVQTLPEQSSANGLMNGLCENIRQLISTLETTKITNQGQYIDCQARMIEVLRQLARSMKTINDSIDIRHLADQLTREYNELVHATYGAIGTANTNELSIRIKKVVQDLGFVLIELIEKLGQNKSKYEFDSVCQKVVEKVQEINWIDCGFISSSFV